MDADLLAGLRALVDQHRLRIVARLAASPGTAEALAAELRQPVPAMRRHLDALEAAGLVQRRTVASGDAVFAARMDRVGDLGRRLAALEREVRGLDAVLPGGAWPHDGEPLAETLARLAPTPDEA